MSSQYEIEGRRLRLELRSVDSGSVVTVANDTADERSDKPSDDSLTPEIRLEGFSVDARFVTLRIGGRSHRLAYHRDGKTLSIAVDGRVFEFRPYDEDDAPEAVAGAFQREIISPMPGKVLEVLVGSGDTVAVDAPLFLVEAMKMEQTVRAASPALVERVFVEPGSRVGPGDTLCTLAPVED